MADTITVESELAEIRRLAPPSAQIVFVSGNFNILHPGHLRLLRFAKECGDFLVVGVQGDELAGHAALLSEALRLEGVRSNSWVDHAFVMPVPAEQLITLLRPAVVVKGKEHESKDNPERHALATYGGRLLFSSGETVFSSMDLLRRELSPIPSSRIRLPEDFPVRHGFTLADLRTLLHDFSGARMVVVGDLIVDEYIDCDPLGMSQEDATIVVTPVFQQSFVGGAGIVAAHAASLGASVEYFSVIGRDELKEVAENRLREYGVSSHLLEDDSRPTTLKRRFRAQGKTLLRVSQLRQHGLSAELQGALLERLRPAVDRADVLVFSDYNYGCLPQPLVEVLSELGRERELVMVADSQCSSQVGDVSRFRGMALLTPTEREARISTHNHEDGLVVLAETVRRQAQARNVLLKLGAEGVLVHAELSKSNQWMTDQLPAFGLAARDTAGAGDSLLAVSALALARRASVWQAAYLGSLAAALQVDRLGNLPIRAEELLAELVGP
jgi:rfaE bifunctional protein kinase chain/domain